MHKEALVSRGQACCKIIGIDFFVTSALILECEMRVKHVAHMRQLLMNSLVHKSFVGHDL